jgi:hypothetical protein
MFYTEEEMWMYKSMLIILDVTQIRGSMEAYHSLSG